MNGSPLSLLDRQHSDIAETFIRVQDENRDRSAELARVVTEIASHVAVERTYLYPLAKKRRLGHPGLAKGLLGDYRKMQGLLVKIDRRKTNSPDMPDLVTELLDTFETHQERCVTISAHVVEHFAEHELDDLARQMKSAEQVIHSHPHPILLRLGGPVYQRTTRLASRWDRLRDRTVRNR